MGTILLEQVGLEFTQCTVIIHHQEIHVFGING